MKISKTQLEQIIKEEIVLLMEQNAILSGDPEANALRDAIANFIDSHQLDNPSKTVMAIVKEFLDNYKKGLMSQAALGGSFFEGQLKEDWDWAHQPDSPSDSDADDYEYGGNIYDDVAAQ